MFLVSSSTRDNCASVLRRKPPQPLTLSRGSLPPTGCLCPFTATPGWYAAFPSPRPAAQRRLYAGRGSLGIPVGSGSWLALLLRLRTYRAGRLSCMSVPCSTWSEIQTLPPILGPHGGDPDLNGQHQLLRGQDSPDPGQYQHQAGQEQAGPGQLVHLPGQEHHLDGLLHYYQREDQDLLGRCLLQPGYHYHLLSKSHVPQTQDALGREGEPHSDLGGQEQKTTNICDGPSPTGNKSWIEFTFGALTVFWSISDKSNRFTESLATGANTVKKASKTSC